MAVWVVVETSSALVALLAALLVVGRYRTSPVLRDLALVHAFVVLAVANLLPNLLPALLEESPPTSVLRLRLVLVGGVLAGASFALAALASDAQAGRRSVSPVAIVPVALLTPALGIGLLERLDVGSAAGPTARVMHAVAAVLYALAAVGFGSHRLGAGDRLRRYLMVGAVLAAAARLTLVVSPHAVTRTAPHLADLFRLCFYGVLLTGVVAEIRSYWQRVAVLEERRRLARDIHDGVAQELAFIATEARRTPGRVQLPLISAAAERALEESRRAISALSGPLDLPLDDAIAATAEEVAGRAGVPVRLDLAPGLDIPPVVREQLLRILREAVGNAARHSDAETITVVLSHADDHVRLQVIDDGRGFEPGEAEGRFGLVTMTERARGVGGELSVASELGTGTIIDLTVPSEAAR